MLGSILRLYHLGFTALWIDEWCVLEATSIELTPWDIIKTIYKLKFTGFTAQHMPFHYVWLNIFLHMYNALGLTPKNILIRLPFALFGIGCLPFCYLCGRKVYSEKVGLWFMFLVSISFFHIYQSRDATSYAPLLFFFIVNLYSLSAILLNSGPLIKGRGLFYSFLFLFSSMGALFTHMSAWILLGSEGIILGGIAAWLTIRHNEFKPSNYFTRSRYVIWPSFLIILSTSPVLRFVIEGASTFNSLSIPNSAEPITLSLVVYQFAHFGFGKGGGRLVIFLFLLLVGITYGIKRKELKSRISVHLGICILPIILFFIILTHNMFPRYLSIIYYQMIGFAAIGLYAIEVRFDREPPWSKRLSILPPAVMVIVLCIWIAMPLRMLYTMRNKVMPMTQIQEWIMTNLPPGSVYLWRNGYHTREVPRTRPTPDRHALFADYPTKGVTEERYQWGSNHTLHHYKQNPFMLVIKDTDFDDPRWDWTEKAYQNHHIIQEPNIKKLFELGFSPHGVNKKTSEARFTIYYNTAEDVLRMAQKQGSDPLMWPVGQGWMYFQPDIIDPIPPFYVFGTIFRGINEFAELAIVKQKPNAIKVNLYLHGFSLESGFIEASLNGGAPMSVPFDPGVDKTLVFGPFEINKGVSTIRLEQFPGDRLIFLIDDTSLEPIDN